MDKGQWRSPASRRYRCDRTQLLKAEDPQGIVGGGHLLTTGGMSNSMGCGVCYHYSHWNSLKGYQLSVTGRTQGLD